MQVGDFITNDIDYIDEEFSQSAGAIIGGVTQLGSATANLQAVKEANKTELERNLKAQCGSRPMALRKKKRAKFDECVDEVTDTINAKQMAEFNLVKSSQSDSNQIKTIQLQNARELAKERQSTQRFIVGSVLGGVAILGMFMVIAKRR